MSSVGSACRGWDVADVADLKSLAGADLAAVINLTILMKAAGAGQTA
jgi:hypothetical protein